MTITRHASKGMRGFLSLVCIKPKSLTTCNKLKRPLEHS